MANIGLCNFLSVLMPLHVPLKVFSLARHRPRARGVARGVKQTQKVDLQRPINDGPAKFLNGPVKSAADLSEGTLMGLGVRRTTFGSALRSRVHFSL